MRALSMAVGVAVRDEAVVEDRLDQIAQRMMHHPVSKRRGTDLAPFGLMNVEMAIVTGAVTEAAQVILQRDQVIGILCSNAAALPLRRLPRAASRYASHRLSHSVM